MSSRNVIHWMMIQWITLGEHIHASSSIDSDHVWFYKKNCCVQQKVKCLNNVVKLRWTERHKCLNKNVVKFRWTKIHK